jgi:hypothetical protein
MIKLIKEFLLSGIEANKAITEAMNSTSKVNKKAVQYYDTIIYNDNLRIEMDKLRLQPPSDNNNSNQVPFHEICSCNPKNGGSGICGCTMSHKMVDRNTTITTTSTTTSNTDLNK